MKLGISEKFLKYFKGYSSSCDVILLFVYFKLRYSLSYRDLEEMMIIRGGRVDHSSIHRWVLKFTPLIKRLVSKSKGSVNGSWRMDETYVKVSGKWKYLYRAVDSNGYTVDFLLRSKRDTESAKAFFNKAIKQHGTPEKTTIDGSHSNKAAIESINNDLPSEKQIIIRKTKYLNNIVEQDHRFIKKRIKPMLGFKSFSSARTTIAGIESIRMIQKGQLIGQNHNSSTFHSYMALFQ